MPLLRRSARTASRTCSSGAAPPGSSPSARAARRSGRLAPRRRESEFDLGHDPAAGFRLEAAGPVAEAAFARSESRSSPVLAVVGRHPGDDVARPPGRRRRRSGSASRRPARGSRPGTRSRPAADDCVRDELVPGSPAATAAGHRRARCPGYGSGPRCRGSPVGEDEVAPPPSSSTGSPAGRPHGRRCTSSSVGAHLDQVLQPGRRPRSSSAPRAGRRGSRTQVSQPGRPLQRAGRADARRTGRRLRRSASTPRRRAAAGCGRRGAPAAPPRPPGASPRPSAPAPGRG